MLKPRNAPVKLYKDIMLKCWAKEPENRPTFETLTVQLDEFFDDSLSHNMADKWEIDGKELTFMSRLSSGNFNEVWEGLWNETKKVAVKMLKKGAMEPAKFLEEAEIMKKMIHPKLVQLYAVCSRKEPIYIVTELMENGSLLDYLRGRSGKLMKMPKLVDIATQVGFNTPCVVVIFNILYKTPCCKNG